MFESYNQGENYRNSIKNKYNKLEKFIEQLDYEDKKIKLHSPRSQPFTKSIPPSKSKKNSKHGAENK